MQEFGESAGEDPLNILKYVSLISFSAGIWRVRRGGSSEYPTGVFKVWYKARCQENIFNTSIQIMKYLAIFIWNERYLRLNRYLVHQSSVMRLMKENSVPLKSVIFTCISVVVNLHVHKNSRK